jgi:hypothetical protein
MLPDELRTDLQRGRRHRFADKIDKSQVVVMLEQDIAELFTTPESVNAVLRALISTMPVLPVKRARSHPQRRRHNKRPFEQRAATPGPRTHAATLRVGPKRHALYSNHEGSRKCLAIPGIRLAFGGYLDL